MQVFEEKCDKLYAGRYAQNLGEINANRYYCYASFAE